jgi:hypothetical protein
MDRVFQLLLMMAVAGFPAAPAWFTAMKDNTWKAVASTGTIASMAPSPTPPGVEGVAAVCNDWTGACANQTTGEYILPAQGGHNGYYGNEIYALALRDATPAWKRIWGPTPNAQIITVDFASNSPYTAYGDGSPRPTHGWFSNLCSSDGNIWVTLVDANPSGKWTTECYSIDRGNLAAGWIYHGRIWPSVPGGAPGSSFGYQSGPGAYDPVGNKIWRGGDFSTDSGIASFDVSTAVTAGAQAHWGHQVPGGKIYSLAQTAFSNAWSVVTDDLSPRCWIVGSPSSSQLWIMELENNPGTFIKKSATGSPSGWTSGVGAAYHRQSRSILVGGYEFGANIRQLSISGTNPLTSTYTWSNLPLDASNSVTPQAGMNGTLSKFQMINDMGNGQSAICFVTSSSGPTYVYKVPGILTATEKIGGMTAFSQMILSPNPASTQTRIAIAGLENIKGFSLEVFDVRGKMIKAADSRAGEMELNINGLKDGVYLLRARTTSGVFHQKLLVQN